MHPAWARSLRDQCHGAESLLLKQWGSSAGWSARVRRRDPMLGCDGIEPQRVTKKLAGRELDGREWNEFPAAAERAVA